MSSAGQRSGWQTTAWSLSPHHTPCVVFRHIPQGKGFFFSLLFFVFNFLIFLSGWETLHILTTVFSSFPTAPLERIWSHREPDRILLLWLSGITQWKNNSIERKWLVICALVSMSPLLSFSVLTGVQIVVPCLDCFNKFFGYLSVVSTINRIYSKIRSKIYHRY